MKSKSSNVNDTNHLNKEENKNQPKREISSPSTLDSRFNQTLRNVQGLLKGRSIPGKVLLTRRADPIDDLSTPERSPTFGRSFSESDTGTSDHVQNPMEVEDPSTGKSNNGNVNKLKSSTSNIENTSKEAHKSPIGTRATDSARLFTFNIIPFFTRSCREITRVSLEWCTTVHAPYCMEASFDRREGVLRRKRLEYFDCVAQFYDIPDTERSDDEINMLRQIAVDCPRTVPDVTFFQQVQIPFHLVTRLWDTYLAEGDALPDFLVYIFASFLLTWSDKLQKLDFQEMVMFLQHLPTHAWTHQELEMVLSRAYMWHSMFNNCPSHLAS
ncbi:hypothetical protein CUMW_148180 [Citrus unshiu]|uniref:Rab-GAP TBC domain-containing protein n=1 Tax=Citrus unshiu TaxID=55188 RepID=A0A2H5PMG5_CITUN|nr:hypothetical protein CUMW_148180 [Citrus unshiu]